MDERNKDLTHLFVRDLDELPLPPRGDWRRAPGRGTAMRASQVLLAAGAIVAVLALALLAGYGLDQRQTSVAGPSSSPSPRQTALFVDPIASASPSASPCLATCGASGSPSPSGIYNDDFGFFVADNDQQIIRTESSSARIATVTGRNVAISQDGRQLAWFTAPGGAPVQLRIAPAADPEKAQTLVTLAPNERGGAIAWANDDSGLVYSSFVQVDSFGPPGSSIQSYAVHTFDLRGTTAPDRNIYQSKLGGLVLVPLAWDRAANIVAFGETGEGGYMIAYDVTRINGTEANTTRSEVKGLSIVMGWVRVSSDAKYVVGSSFFASDPTGFFWWPLADFSARHVPAESKYGKAPLSALWRPGTHEIGFIGPSNQFWLCDVDRDTPLGCGHTAVSGIPDGANLRGFRADGSAVIVVSFTGTPNRGTYTLIRLGSDPKATSGDRVTFTELNGFLASVRIGGVR